MHPFSEPCTLLGSGQKGKIKLYQSRRYYFDIYHFHLTEVALLQELQHVKVVTLDVEVFGRVPVAAFLRARAQRLANRPARLGDGGAFAHPCELVKDEKEAGMIIICGEKYRPITDDEKNEVCTSFAKEGLSLGYDVRVAKHKDIGVLKCVYMRRNAEREPIFGIFPNSYIMMPDDFSFRTEHYYDKMNDRSLLNVDLGELYGGCRERLVCAKEYLRFIIELARLNCIEDADVCNVHYWADTDGFEDFNHPDVVGYFEYLDCEKGVVVQEYA